VRGRSLPTTICLIATNPLNLLQYEPLRLLPFPMRLLPLCFRFVFKSLYLIFFSSVLCHIFLLPPLSHPSPLSHPPSHPPLPPPVSPPPPPPQALQALQRQPNAAQYFQQLMLQQQISNAQLHNLAAVQQVNWHLFIYIRAVKRLTF